MTKKTRNILILSILAASLSGCIITAILLVGFIAIGGAGTLDITGVTVLRAFVGPGLGYDYLSATYAVGLLIASVSARFLPMGLVIWALDPVIIQVPANVTNVVATYDCSADGAGNLTVTPMARIPVSPGVFVDPEPGQQFIRFEFPSGGVNIPNGGATCDFHVTFDTGADQSLSFKPVMTARVEAGGETYFAPLLPCLNNGGDLSAMTPMVIPFAANAQPLAVPAQYANLGCVYPDGFEYRAAGPTISVPVMSTAAGAGLAAAMGAAGIFGLRRRRNKALAGKSGRAQSKNAGSGA